jgi:hypothetical protein
VGFGARARDSPLASLISGGWAALIFGGGRVNREAWRGWGDAEIVGSGRGLDNG